MLAHASLVHAQQTVPAAAPYALPPYPQLHYRPRVWYGYQLLLSDAAALGLGILVGALNDGSDSQQQGDIVAITWGAGMLGATAVHSAHRNAALGTAGLAMRLALPPFGALLGVASNCMASPDHPCSAAGARVGFAIGVGTAALIDSLVLARARPPADGAPDWYGWKTLFIDGAALAAGISIAASQPDLDRTETGVALMVIPYTAGFLISPWMHALHGRTGLAFASLGLRALAPPLLMVGGIAGYCAASGSEPRCTKEGAIYGLLFGTLLTAAVDIGVFSYERPPTNRAQATSTSIAPFITPIRGGATAGLTGTL